MIEEIQRLIYFMLIHEFGITKKNFIFDFSFILISHRSIARTAGVDSPTLKTMARDLELNFEIEERELKLAKCIIKYPDILTRVLDELLMHGLCEFMYQLATTFTDFYDRCYCVEKDRTTGEVRINYRRILLCEATANVLKQCFDILGIQPLERM